MTNEYYAAFKDDIALAREWFEDNELNKLTYHDVVIFRITHRIGESKSSTVEAINSDTVRRVTERDYCVEFLKITKQMPNKRVLTYIYNMPYASAGLLVNGSPLFEKASSGCRYMPTGYVIPVGDELNDTGVEIVMGRETTGKYVCDQVDKSRIATVRSLQWVPSIKYPMNKRSTLPKAVDTDVIPNCVVNTLSLLAKVGSGVYEVSKDNTDFNGIVVTPVLALYEQIVNAKTISSKL